MILVPSLEVLDGRLVRLKTSRPEDAIVLGRDPLQTVRELRQTGAMFFHVVDLDAVFGIGNNDSVLQKLVEDMVPFQVRGGIRTAERANHVLGLGADRVVLGAFVFEEPAIAEELVAKFGMRVMASMDVRNGRVLTSAGEAGIEMLEAIQVLKKAGVAQAVYNRIDEEGEDAPFDAAEMRTVLSDADLRFYARCTARNEEQLRELLELEDEGLLGLILNHALDSESVDLKRALATA